MKRTIPALVALLAVVIGASACQPAPTYPTNRVTFEGDSLMVQAAAYSDPSDGRFLADANGDLVNVPGGHMSAGSGWSTPMAQFDATADRRQLPEVLVMTTGHNDSWTAAEQAGGDGWSRADRDRYAANVRSVPPAADVVLMLPGVAAGVSDVHRTEIGKVRRSIQAIAAENPDRVCAVVDFQLTIDRNEAAGTPIIVGDGIHKGNNAAHAAREYIDTIWGGLQQCGVSS